MALAAGYQDGYLKICRFCKNTMVRSVPCLDTFQTVTFIDKDELHKLLVRSKLKSAKLFKLHVYSPLMNRFKPSRLPLLNPPFKLKLFNPDSHYEKLVFVVLNVNGIPYIATKPLFPFLGFSREEVIQYCTDLRVELIPTHLGIYPWEFVSEQDLQRIFEHWERLSYHKDFFWDFWNYDIMPCYPKDQIVDPPDILEVETDIKPPRKIKINYAKKFMDSVARKQESLEKNPPKPKIVKSKITSIEQINSVKDLLEFLTHATSPN